MNDNEVRSHDDGRCFVYVGTYTQGESKGIYAFQFSTATGALIPTGLAAEMVNPSFLALHPSGRFLYAVGEVKQYEGNPCGFVSAYSIDHESGQLTLLGEVPSGGLGPCHIALDRRGKFAIVSNYVNGSVAVLRIQDDGRLGDLTAVVQHSDASASQTRPHAHGAFFSGDNRFVVVPDLGLDRLFIYRLDPNTGALEPAEPASVTLPQGTGPRHFAFHPSGDYGYVINERNSTITAFQYEESIGKLDSFLDVSTLPAGFVGENATAEIEVDPEGRFLYASNRGANNIAVFVINPEGCFDLIEHVATQGRTPRHFAIDPSGSFLLAANQDTNNLVVFRRDGATGHLAQTGQQVKVPAPACVLFATPR